MANTISPEYEKDLALTCEELAELERAKKMPIIFDEDCPETTPEKAIKFRRVNPLHKSTGTHISVEMFSQ